MGCVYWAWAVCTEHRLWALHAWCLYTVTRRVHNDLHVLWESTCAQHQGRGRLTAGSDDLWLCQKSSLCLSPSHHPHLLSSYISFCGLGLEPRFSACWVSTLPLNCTPSLTFTFFFFFLSSQNLINCSSWPCAHPVAQTSSRLLILFPQDLW